MERSSIVQQSSWGGRWGYEVIQGGFILLLCKFLPLVKSDAFQKQTDLPCINMFLSCRHRQDSLAFSRERLTLSESQKPTRFSARILKRISQESPPVEIHFLTLVVYAVKCFKVNFAGGFF